MHPLFLDDHRCSCGKLLLKGVFFDANLEIKCKKCGEINRIGNVKLADDASHYFLIINKQGKITSVSDSACRILGYTPSELIGKSFMEIDTVISKKMKKMLVEAELILTEDNFFQLNTIHQTREGQKIPVIVRLKSYQLTEKEKYILVSAGLKNLAEKNSDKIKSIFSDNNCDLYFEVDANGVSESVSPSVEQYFGYSQEAIIGNFFFDYLSQETKTKFKEIFDYFSAIEQPFRSLHSIWIDIHDQHVHTELYFTSKFNDVGKFVGYSVLGWLKKP